MADRTIRADQRQHALDALGNAQDDVARVLSAGVPAGRSTELMMQLQASALMTIAVGVITLADEVADLRDVIEKGQNDG